MQAFHRIDYSEKSRFYAELDGEVRGLLETVWFTNLSNVSASLMAHLPEINWVGFYLAQDQQLILGPFQGLPACLRIPFGRGVCGTAAQTKETLIVPDVEAFPGHIACDARSRSEIVVPLVKDGRVLGVLDLDAPIPNRFDAQDREGLERIVRTLMSGTKWPDQFL